MLNVFYRVAFRKTIHPGLEELHADLDVFVAEYNTQRSHQGRWWNGKTPMRTFLDTIPLANEKLLAQQEAVS